MQGVMYYNPSRINQCIQAKAFKSCGFETTTAVRKPDPEVCVISGPWYARDAVKNHKRTLMIDRAWWNDPDCVSIGWLKRDGTRKFAHGSAPRPKPNLLDWKPVWDMGEIRCIVLADYGQDVSETVRRASERFPSVQVRVHPADSTTVRSVTLEMDCQFADVVVGHSGTALFEAIKNGTPVICTDSQNECMPVCSTFDEPLYRGDREQWLHEMSYKQFTLAEIADGTAWSLLKDIQ